MEHSRRSIAFSGAQARENGFGAQPKSSTQQAHAQHPKSPIWVSVVPLWDLQPLGEGWGGYDMMPELGTSDLHGAFSHI